MTAQATDSQDTSASDLLGPVLADLERVVSNITDDDLDRPTPCVDFTVAEERSHVLGWVRFFAAAANDPAGKTERPDPDEPVEPAGSADAARTVKDAAEQLAAASAALSSDDKMKVKDGEMPGTGAARLILWEYLVHGWDLAVATGQPWDPPAQAGQIALDFAKGMLTDQWRGPDSFGPEVDVPDDASALDKLLGFSGRQPDWTPPS